MPLPPSSPSQLTSSFLPASFNCLSTRGTDLRSILDQARKFENQVVEATLAMGQYTMWLTTSQMCLFMHLSLLFLSQLRLALCLLQTSCILDCLVAIRSLKFSTFLPLTPCSEKKAGLSKMLAWSKLMRRRRRDAKKKQKPSNSRLS